MTEAPATTAEPEQSSGGGAQPAVAHPDECPTFAPDGARVTPAPGRTNGYAWHCEDRLPAPARAAVVSLVFLSVVGGLAAGLLALPRTPVEPVFVSVPVGELDDPAWPSNPWADRDADLLVPQFAGRSVKAFGFQQSDRLRTLLSWVADRGAGGATGLPARGRSPLVLHLTALAVVRGGEVFVLPGDAAPGAPGTWVNVKDVIRAVADGPGVRSLLLLDLAHPVADPFGGILSDDVSEVLARVLEEAPVPVLTACGPGEPSLPADAAGASAFAWCLAEGLSGAADGAGDPNGPDGSITATELVRFTQERVGRWARVAHGRQQTPTRYGPTGRAADFVLVRRIAGPPAASPVVRPYPDWLRDAWHERELARDGAVARREPLALAQLTADLLRVEELWLRPGPTHRAEEACRDARRRWSEAVARTPPPADWSGLPAARARLAVARAGKPDPPPELAKALTALLVARPEQAAEAERAWVTAANPQPVAAVNLVWRLAADTVRPSAEMVERWALAAGAADPVSQLAETGVLRTLAARGTFRRQRLAEYPAAAVAALVRAEDELGRAVALGPDAFDVARERFVSAAADRRAGADLLFAAGTADQVATATARLERAAEGFRLGRADLERARRARRELEAACLVLGETLPAVTEFDRPGLRSAWFAAADFAERVSAVDSVRADPAEVAGLAAQVARLRGEFGPAVFERLVVAERRAEPEGIDARRRLLAGAGFGSPTRKAAWESVTADAAALHAAALAPDERPFAPAPDQERESARAVRRAEASVRLLRLAGARAATDAEAMLRRAQVGGRAEDWAALGDRLRTAWLAELPSQFDGAPAAEQARILRAVTPGLARHRPWATKTARPLDTGDGAVAFRAWVETVAAPLVQEERP